MDESPDGERELGRVLLKRGGENIRARYMTWGKYRCIDVRRFEGDRPTGAGLRLQTAHWARLLQPITSGIELTLEEAADRATE